MYERSPLDHPLSKYLALPTLAGILVLVFSASFNKQTDKERQPPTAQIQAKKPTQKPVGAFVKGFAPPDVIFANGPPCPKCEGETRLRHGKYGYFYSCLRFPACQGSANAPEWNKLKRDQKASAASKRQEANPDPERDTVD